MGARNNQKIIAQQEKFESTRASTKLREKLDCERQLLWLLALCISALSGCASPPQPPESAAMTRAATQPLPQAPQQSQQAVKAPLPPPAREPAPSTSSNTLAPYVRIDTGWSFGRKAGFTDDVAVAPTCFIAVIYPGVCGADLNHVGSSPIFGVSIGYRITPGVRADISVARRNGYELKGSDPEGTFFDPKIISDSILANAYFDLPFKWMGAKPFIGAGIGYGRNKMDPIKWTDPTSSGVLPGGASRGLVWQLTIGTDITIAKNWILEVGYRYVDLGKIKKDAGPDIAGQFNPPPNGTGSATGKLRTDEVLIGFRHSF